MRRTLPGTGDGSMSGRTSNRLTISDRDRGRQPSTDPAARPRFPHEPDLTARATSASIDAVGLARTRDGRSRRGPPRIAVARDGRDAYRCKRRSRPRRSRASRRERWPCRRSGTSVRTASRRSGSRVDPLIIEHPSRLPPCVGCSMILCVTLNPCLDKTLTVPAWRPGDSVRGLVRARGGGGQGEQRRPRPDATRPQGPPRHLPRRPGRRPLRRPAPATTTGSTRWSPPPRPPPASS